MNQFHRWFCRSAFWRKALSEGLIPWALKNIDLGEDLLEVGPGPGLATDVLRQRYARVTAIEVDESLAASLEDRLRNTNVQVVKGDATAMPFEDGSFSGAVCFTMLHHVPSVALQGRLLAEVFRVLRAGAMFAGTDSTWSRAFQLIHLFDTMVVVDPSRFGVRLEAAGFTQVSVDLARGAFRFRARRP
ncbi:MAG TPA: class I SAM-dependent methyltransferase [Blastocatellia bacterium]|nr:class I SAM-dependent methyltransferase [Blastocatellia bacterium]